VLPFAAAAGLGALLLFQVQLLLGKRFLPWFGGTSALWTTCLLFFQAALLAGYAWAHLLADRLAPRRQRDLHLALVGLALALVAWRGLDWPSPLTPGDSWRPVATEPPVRAVLGRLAAVIGLPFVALAATSPLLQAWLARVRPEASPLWLFALSNGGSLLGLLSYPWLVERHLGLPQQGWLWAGAFAVHAALMAACAAIAGRVPAAPAPAADPPPWAAPLAAGPAIGAGCERLLWLGLSAVPSLLLLAVTSHLTQEVAAVPLLWMLPLATYLASFVLCFARPLPLPREAWGPALAAAAVLAVFGLARALDLGARTRIGLWLAVLFVYGTACHGELVRWRPAAGRLTAYYLTIATGGALGGVLGALVAPRVLDGYWELHLALVAGPLAVAAAWLAGGPLPFASAGGAGARVRLGVFAAGVVVALGAGLALDVAASRRGSELARRGFYGVLRVEREGAGTSDEARKLLHGRIAHGLQLVDPARRLEPTTYFGPSSGVGLALHRHPKRLAGEPLRVGVVGLGVGTLAAWTRPGDAMRFYELDPEVVRLSAGETPVFTFVREARGELSIVTGDGRLALAAEDPQGFDVLVLDAFSSDAIPTHLLTREAFSVFERHLAPGGALVVQVTNRYVDLKPVVRGVASSLGLRALHVPSFERGTLWSSDWVLVARDSPLLEDELVTAASLPAQGAGPDVVWTDDWSELAAVLKR
jgi:spermidine synthase